MYIMSVWFWFLNVCLWGIVFMFCCLRRFSWGSCWWDLFWVRWSRLYVLV